MKTNLLKRELGRYVSTPVCLTNTVINAVILLAIGVAAVVMRMTLRILLRVAVSSLAWVAALVPALFTFVVCLVAVFNTLSAASVSLEGADTAAFKEILANNKGVLKTKALGHVVVNGAQTVIAAALVGYAVEQSGVIVALMAVVSLLFVCLSAVLGVKFNSKKPNFTWKKASRPVNFSGRVALTRLCVIVLEVLFFGGSYITKDMLSTVGYMGISAAVLFVLTALCSLGLNNKAEEMLSAKLG